MSEIELPPQRAGQLWAALYMAAAAALLSVMIASVRMVADDLDAPVIVFFRSLIGILLFAPLIARRGISFLATARIRLFLARGTIAAVSMILWYYALSVTPLAEAVSLSFTAPLFATVAAILYLGERVGRRRWAAIAIGFAGVLLILRPGFAEITLAHVLLLLSSAMVAVSIMMVKVLARSEPPERIVAWLVIMMAPMTLGPALFVWSWPQPEHYFWLAVIAFGGTGGHVMMTRALALADASAVMPYDFLRLPFVALIGWLAFSELLDVATWIGGAVIFTSSAYIAHREALAARRGAATVRPASTAAEGAADSTGPRR